MTPPTISIRVVELRPVDGTDWEGLKDVSDDPVMWSVVLKV